MNFKVISPEVLYATEDVRTFGEDDVQDLLRRAMENSSGKCRICFHHLPEAPLHEMLIAIRRGANNPPHRCRATEETHFMLRGLARLRLYEEDGTLARDIEMGPPGDNRTSYVRIPQNLYHDMIVESGICLYMEIKLGPFNPENNEQAPFPGRSLE